MMSCLNTTERLGQTFSTFGIPRVLVSDNGSPFTRSELQRFMHENGITHQRVAPYHRLSNSLSEKVAETFKEGMKKL